MGRRIEVELTSSRDDGSWTWRAAGARQPKGDLDGSLLYEGAKIGDVVRVEADFHLDGIEVVEVFAPKGKKERTDLLELKTRPLRDDELVTTQRVGRGDRRGGRGRRGDRPGRRDQGDSGRKRPRSAAPPRPKPKRLRPRRVHRDALLATVTEEHRPIVEQVVRDGMPGVRAAIERQNSEAKQAGKPEIDAAPILAIAEQHLNQARLAEWRDRADAALADAAELDLRDLRSVVVVGGDVARDDESRGIADQLKQVLDERMESDHSQWLADLRASVLEGRVVRALRLSSRPVKAGAPLPTELASELAQQASKALAADVEQSRWATVLDALAFSPVRGAVTPVGVPAEPKEELLGEVRRLSDRLPAIAGLFGIDPADVPKSAKRRRRPSRGKSDKKREGAKGRKSESGPKRSPKREASAETAAAAKPEAETSPAPTPEPAPEPEAETSPAPTPEPAPEPEAETSPAPTPEPAPEPEAETSPAPTPEPAPEPGVAAESAKPIVTAGDEQE